MGQTSRSHFDTMMLISTLNSSYSLEMWEDDLAIQYLQMHALLSLTISVNDLEIQIHISIMRDRKFDFFLETILYRARIIIRSSCKQDMLISKIYFGIASLHIPPMSTCRFQPTRLFTSDYGPSQLLLHDT
jgi:hypothetical protein